MDCGVRVTYRVLGFCFRVQSAKYTPPFLEHRINTFIASLSQVLVSIHLPSRILFSVLVFSWCRQLYIRSTTKSILLHLTNLQNMILIVCSHALQKEMTDEEFTSYKTALVEQKLERDHSLLDETDRHWEQIWDQRYEAYVCQE